MNVDLFKEGLGYAASLIILISLLMTNVFRLRAINLVGSLCFALYGWWIGAWPVCLINAVIAGIDGWYLLRLMRVTGIFELSQVSNCSGAEYLKRFFLFHERELMKYAPGLTIETLQAADTFLIFLNMLPVGVFSYRQNEAEAEIVLDYMIPEYRDFKAGRFVYRTKRMFFKERGIKRFHATARHPSQPKYFLKNGFVREEGASDHFVNTL